MFGYILILFLAAPSFAHVHRRAVNRNNHPELLWQTDRAIPFFFGSDFVERDHPAVLRVIEEIQSRTCLTFKDVSMATGIKQPTIIFVNGSDGCHAMEGKRPDYRLLAVNLDETVCRERRSYFHELFHVLGLQHTHTRPDRDDYIRFYEKRTAADWLDQYEKMTEDNSYGVPYDFDSVMHYIPDGTDTLKHEENMKAKNELYQFAMGRNVYGAAHSDYLQLNRLYNCFDKCMSVKTTCANGGFVNPNSCQECICPRGFAGASCEDLDYDESVQHRCGGYEYATDSWKDLDMELSANVDNITCYWFLKASQGKRIEIKLVKVAPENQRCTPDTNTWLEVRLGTFEIGGYKFYCQQQLPERTLTSGDNLAVVTLSQDYDDATQLKLMYRTSMLFVLFLLLFASTAYGRRQTRAAVNENNYPERLWQKDRPIPFKFSDDIPEKDRRNVRLVIRSIEQNSCLKFAEVSNANETTIFFKNGTKCLSMQIGKDTSIRLYPIELGEYCRRDYDYFFILVRTLGLCGGHQRPDRNGYVIYDENNTNPNSRQYFDKVSFWDCKDFGVPYDFDSVLHYPPDWFTINESKPNLIAKDPLHQYGMGRNTGPAHSDYLLLNRLYKCPDNCAYAKTKCENSGFVNPNNCQWCICPRGFAGAFCERLDYDGHKDKNCGGYLDAIGSWQELSVERGENQNNISCYWFLRASQGKDVEIQLVTVAPENKRCTANTNTWLEVRLGTFEIGGYKFYCTDQLPKRILRSSGSLAVVTLSQDYNDPTRFKLLFRSVAGSQNIRGRDRDQNIFYIIAMIIFLAAVVGIRTYFIRRRAPWYNGYQGNGENTYVHVTFV